MVLRKEVVHRVTVKVVEHSINVACYHFMLIEWFIIT